MHGNVTDPPVMPSPALIVTLIASALAGCASLSHYAGMKSRDIKALSPKDVEGLMAGRGMSSALAQR